jgi:hypothetical protein
MIEGFPRAEVDRVGREDVACRVEVGTPDGLAGRVEVRTLGDLACRVEVCDLAGRAKVRTPDDLARLRGGRVGGDGS